MAAMLASDAGIQEAIKTVAILASNAPNQHFSSLIGLIDSKDGQQENWLVHVDVKSVADEDMEMVAAEFGIPLK